MPYCAVVTCKRRTESNNLQTDGTSFHRFPSQPEVKEKWIEAVGRGPVWWPSKTSTICSAHFKEKQYQVLPKKRKLFDWAVPSLKLPPSSNRDTLTKPEDIKMKVELKKVDSKRVDSGVIKEVIYFDKTCERVNLATVKDQSSKNESTESCVGEDSQMDPLNPKKQKIAMQDEAHTMDQMRIQIKRYKSAVIQKNKKIKTLLGKTRRYRETIAKLRYELTQKSLQKNVSENENLSNEKDSENVTESSD